MRGWKKVLLWVVLALVLLFGALLLVYFFGPDRPASNFVYDGF